VQMITLYVYVHSKCSAREGAERSESRAGESCRACSVWAVRRPKPSPCDATPSSKADDGLKPTKQGVACGLRGNRTVECWLPFEQIHHAWLFGHTYPGWLLDGTGDTGSHGSGLIRHPRGHGGLAGRTWGGETRGAERLLLLSLAAPQIDVDMTCAMVSALRLRGLRIRWAGIRQATLTEGFRLLQMEPPTKKG